MERRLWLAILLSVVVIMFWGRLFPPPPSPSPSAENTQTPDIKEDKEVKTTKVLVQPEKPLPSLLGKSQEETLLGEKMSIKTSTLGGKILAVSLTDFQMEFPMTIDAGILEEDAIYSKGRESSKEISYVLEDKGLRIEKSYSLTDEQLLYPSVSIENTTDQPVRLDNFGLGYVLDISRLDKKYDNRRDQGLLEYSVALEDEVIRKTNAAKFTEKENTRQIQPVKWIGFRNRYFCSILKPKYSTSGYSIEVLGQKKIKVVVFPKDVIVPAGGTVKYDNVAYFGPQNQAILKSYDEGFEDIFVFFRRTFFDGIAKGMYHLINFMQKIVKNWGVSIILIALLINALTYPLTLKSMLSMKKMQALQPKMTKLKEQYKNNPEKLNREMMELYKKHKINPVGGCLPLFLQMPVFIGIYQVLWRSVHFKGAHFLWIKDLSEPDRLFALPFDLPIIGNEFNILPLVMVVLMFFQQKFSQKNMVVTDPSQQTQQKMMMYFFPIFLGFIFYKFASGISLYFTVFYFISTLTQWKMSRQVRAEA